MTHRLGRMPLPTEVDTFEAKVGGDDEVATGGRAEDGAVITYPGDYRTSRK